LFEVVTGAKPGELKPETRRAVIRAELATLRAGAMLLGQVLPETTQVERNMMRLAFCAAIGELDQFDELADAVRRVAAARAAGA
jgi:hypothetical protein